MESLSSPGAAPAPAGGEMKRKRTAFDKKEKEIFCTILKNSDGGRIWRIINEGTTTNQTRHDAWTRVAKLFNESTGKEMNNTQVRAMYVRMKDKIKKKHDHDAIDRDFNKSCAKTGGGRGPTLPQDKDGDAMDELELSELEPTDTNWNTLVRPENRFPLHFPAQAARARSMTPPAASSPRLAPSGSQFKSFAGPIRPQLFFPFGRPQSHGRASPSPLSVVRYTGAASQSQELDPNLEHPLPAFPITGLQERTSHTHRRRSSPSPLRVVGSTETATQSQEFDPDLNLQLRASPPPVSREGSPQVHPEGEIDVQNSPLSAPRNMSDQVIIYSEDGQLIGVENLQEETPSRTQKKQTKTTKKNMNEEASNYYNMMLKIQKKLSRQKMINLKRKERVEILREEVLKNILVKGGGEIPECLRVVSEPEEHAPNTLEDDSDDTSDERNDV